MGIRGILNSEHFNQGIAVQSYDYYVSHEVSAIFGAVLWLVCPGGHKTWPCWRVTRPPLLLVAQCRIAPGDCSGSRL